MFPQTEAGAVSGNRWRCDTIGEDQTLATTEMGEATRRDFLYIATGAVGAVGVGALAWPFISQMNPDASALALASVEVDVSNVAEGQQIKVMWRGKPLFIRNRTSTEVEEAKAVDISELRDPLARNLNLAADAPATDENRAAGGAEGGAADLGEKLIVMVGVCTHLGCIPLGEAGDFDGWFCPCHGSHYDTAGRIRKGPAPENLLIPPYQFTSETVITIG